MTPQIAEWNWFFAYKISRNQSQIDFKRIYMNSKQLGNDKSQYKIFDEELQ